MNKIVPAMMLLVFLLAACRTDIASSWEEEEVVEVSNRILTEDISVKWDLGAEQAPGLDTMIRLEIYNNGKPIEDFEVNHEKLLHLIVVSKDLSYFNHIHPEYVGEGVFEITNQFPAGGEYRLIADFKPTDGESVSMMEWVTVEGETVKKEAVTVENNLEKVVDKKHVSLSISHPLEAEKEVTLEFTLTDESTGEPISTLQPYLGSIGHVVVLSEDGESYLHVHALEDQGSGPTALFETEFPESGIYKIWAQFQKNNQVFTVPFVIEIP